MKHIPHFMLLVLLACAGIAGAADLHGLEDPSDRERFQRLSFELRCPKCQNQNIADSNAPVAEDLRRELVRMINEGRSDTEIVDFMVARYGDFVLYRPPVTARTLALWYGPAIMLLLGALVIWRLARRRDADTEVEQALDAEEQARLRSLLDGEGKQ